MDSMSKSVYLAKILLCFYFILGVGYSHAYTIQSFSVSKGLSSREVSDGTLDKKGYLWLATRNGIDRYDGTNFVHYPLGPQTLTRREHPKHIVHLSNGQLFASTEHEVYCYMNHTNHWKRVYSIDRTQEHIISLSHTDSTLWIGTNKKIYICPDVDKTVDSLYVQHIPFPRLMAFYQVIKANGHLYAATTRGIWTIHPSADHYEVEKLFVSPKINNRRIQTLFYDSDHHTLWIGSFNRGLWRYNLRSHKHQQLNQLADQLPVRSILSIDSTHVWTAVDGYGIYVWNRKKGTLETTYTKSTKQPYTLPTNSVYTIINTPGQVWVTTFDKGVFRFKKNYFVNHIYRHHLDVRESLIDDNVNAFFEDKQGRYWIGTNNGLDCYNPIKDTWKHYLSADNKKRNIILAITEDSQGNVYASGYATRLYSINPNGKVSALPTQTNKEYVYALYTDDDNVVWMGGIINPLRAYDTKNHTIVEYSIRGVHQILPYHDEQLFVATNHGLFIINKSTREVQQVNFKQYGGVVASLNNCVIFSMSHTPEEPDVLWLGTEGAGVIKLNLLTHEAVRYDQSDGLSTNFICAVAHDLDGRLWATTNWGINCIDDRTGQVDEFNTVSDHNAESYNYRSVGRNRQGHLFFGTSNGLLEINPSRFVSEPKEWVNLRFNRLVISNKEVHPQSEGSPLKIHIDDTDRLKLKYHQRSFALTFSNVNVHNSTNVRYSWRLLGFDNQWTIPSKRYEAVYTNIPPGDYTLEVKVMKTGNSQQHAIRKLSIHIAPPIWQSTWAYVIYFFVLGGILYLVLYSYKERIEAKSSDDKIRFFVNMAHDIRTPLTLVKAPLVDLHRRGLEDADRLAVQTALSNTEKLIRLVNQLLNFQKSEREALQLQVEKLDIAPVIQSNLVRFSSIAKSVDVELVTNIQDGIGSGYIDKSKLEVILDNLISNAIKYSRSSSEVCLDAAVENDVLHLVIRDHGIGISKQDQKQLFKRFYRASNAANHSQVGSGIGLMLTKKLIELHHGTILIDSELNRGTTCHVTLPVDKEAYTTLEICSESAVDDILSPTSEINNVVHREIPASSASTDVHLMIVEDNTELREYLVSSLSHLYHVLPAVDGQDALEKIQKHKPDFVLSDIVMPRMNGLELCRRIKDNIETCHIPVVLLTALSEREDFLEGFEAGADDYVPKPFDVEILERKIASTLHNRRLFREKYIDQETIIEKVNQHEEKDHEFLQLTMNIIEQHLCDDQFSVDTLALELGMSRSVFYKRLKALTSHNPQEIIKDIKMKKAVELLKSGDYLINEVSDMTGFPNPKYFSTVFKKYYGMTPTKYVQDSETEKDEVHKKMEE